MLECIVNVAIDDSVDVARNSSRMEVSSRAFVVDLPYLAVFHAAVRTIVSINEFLSQPWRA